MSAPNWSSTAPRSAWYYTRDPANPDTYVRHYTTWMEIMRDARANLGLAPTPVAWNGEFTEAMARFLQSRGASASAVAQALAPVRSQPAAFDLRLVGFAIWAAKYPTIPLSQFNQGGQWMVGLSTNASESTGLILPQYVQQLSQGTGNPVVPNSSLGGTPTTTAPPPGGTPGGTPGGKPPGGSPAVVVTGDVKPPGTTTPPGPGGTGTTTTTPPPPSTTPPVEPPAPPAPLPTASVVNSGQQLRLVLFVLGGIAVVFGALTLLMRSEQKRAVGSQGRLPARV